MPGHRDDPLIAHYDDALAEHGANARGACWAGAEIQRLNFEEVARVGDLNGARILEIGCGTAALAGFISERHRDTSYVGVDISADVLAAAHVDAPDLDLRVHDIVAAPIDERFDWVLASGTFNLTELGHFAQLDRVRAGLAHMFECATRGVACTFLSDAARVDPVGCRAGALRFHYERPGDLIEAALAITPHVHLRHAAVDADAMTLYLYREPAPHAAVAVRELTLPTNAPEIRTRIDALGFVGALDAADAVASAMPAGPLRDYAAGMVHLERDDMEQAQLALANAAPTLPDARSQLAAVAWALGDYEGARELVESRLGGDANDAEIEVLVEACLQTGDVDGAVAALASRPPSAQRAYLAARLAHISGDDEGAERELLTAWAEAPYSEAIAMHLFLLAINRGDDHAAFHWGRRARTLGSDNPQLIEALDQLTHELLGDDPSALNRDDDPAEV